MTPPKVSIVVPIYKVDPYLMQCLESIVTQTLRDIEIILVDEGDHDVCYAIMKLYEAEDSRVKVIYQKCGGYGAACNLGFEAAAGEYIGIVESDDFIEPTMFEEMYKKAKELDADVLKTPFYSYYDKTSDAPAYKKECDYKELITKVSPAGAFNILDYPHQMSVHASVWSGIYKTSFMKKNNIKFIAAKGAGYVDVEFRIRTFVEAKRIAWIGREFYNYRCTNTFSSTNNFDLTAMLQRWKEAHDYFESKSPSVYAKVGSYLFLDEYLNTFALFFLREITDVQFAQMKKNLARIDDAIILKTPKLKKSEIQQILALKQYNTKEEVLQHAARPLYERIFVYFDEPKTSFISAVQRNVSSAQQLVDCYWDSTCWRLTRPLRNYVRRLRRLPAETRPTAANDDDARQIASVIVKSFSWRALAPARFLATRLTKR